MGNVTVDFSVTQGAIKHMDAVNNGPVAPSVRMPQKSNFDLYKTAQFPYMRNHDASFCMFYGGEHSVDVHRIFKNFDADENDPESYIFEPTDKYLLNTVAAGTKIFYRLGASIEHGFKYGTRVPKDFHKWARICEHIIRHYNEGWANGYELDIEYWEIWNEPDCRNPDGSNPCWQGTDEQFVELYCTGAKYLKEKFPHLKIGGPAVCVPTDPDNPEGFVKKFLTGVKESGAPLDFYSFHCYAREPEWVAQTARIARRCLDDYGFADTETNLNEWNYVQGWSNDEWAYTIKAEQDLKGASFVTAAMSLCQAAPLDMLMYYDARPCAMNGIFSDDFKALKGYYSFLAFRRLKELGAYVPVVSEDRALYGCAATDGQKHALMLTFFDNDAHGSLDMALEKWRAGEDETSYRDCYREMVAKGVDALEIERRDVCIKLENLNGSFKARFYCTDEDKNLALVREEEFPAGTTELHLNMTVFSTWLVEIE